MEAAFRGFQLRHCDIVVDARFRSFLWGLRHYCECEISWVSSEGCGMVVLLWTQNLVYFPWGLSWTRISWAAGEDCSVGVDAKPRVFPVDFGINENAKPLGFPVDFSINENAKPLGFPVGIAKFRGLPAGIATYVVHEKSSGFPVGNTAFSWTRRFVQHVTLWGRKGSCRGFEAFRDVTR